MTQTVTPSVIITITLPANEGEHATLLIQRGDLAHLRQFAYTDLDDVTAVLHEAANSLLLIESDPPMISEVPPPAPKAAVKPDRKPEPQESTIDVPLKKGSARIKISHLKITGGETDAAAYRQAVLIAGKLIDGDLWDGKTPIHLTDVYATARKMKHLSDKELSLFRLEDFVQLHVNELHEANFQSNEQL
jgi:hypothetical protein